MIDKAPPNKSPGEGGVENRMVKAGGEPFQNLLHEVFDALWEYDVQPKAWQYSLLQPIHKGGTKPKLDPASYRGIFLCSVLAKLFEGILITRLTAFTESHNTLTDNQLGIRPGRNAHDAIYSLLALIQHNLNHVSLQRPTYVAFIDYTTSFPSVFRHKLLCLLFENKIFGRMWKHLRVRFWSAYVRVLHPGIPAHERVEVLPGLPEGSKLSPILFGIFMADLVHELQRKFPNATISHGPLSSLGGECVICRRCCAHLDWPR